MKLQKGQTVRFPDGSLWKVQHVNFCCAVVKTVKGHGKQKEIHAYKFEQPRTLTISPNSLVEIVDNEV